jgi:hypothetical protein
VPCSGTYRPVAVELLLIGPKSAERGNAVEGPGDFEGLAQMSTRAEDAQVIGCGKNLRVIISYQFEHPKAALASTAGVLAMASMNARSKKVRTGTIVN